jgi:hypothetical protein
VVFDEDIFPFAKLHANAGALLEYEILLLPKHIIPLDPLHDSMNIMDDPSANFPNCVHSKCSTVDGVQVAKSSGVDTQDDLESMEIHVDSVPVPPTMVLAPTVSHASASSLDSGLDRALSPPWVPVGPSVPCASAPLPPCSPVERASTEASPLAPGADPRADFILGSSTPPSPGVAEKGEIQEFLHPKEFINKKLLISDLIHGFEMGFVTLRYTQMARFVMVC